MTPALMAVMGYAILNLYFGLWGGVGGFLVCLLVGALLGNVLLKNPFSLMLEGKGILMFDISSTGVVRPFLVGVKSPYVEGKLGEKNVKDVFDREAVYNLAAPQKASNLAVPLPDGGISLQLTEEELNKMWILRKVINPMDDVEIIELLIDRMRKTKNNSAFLRSMNTSSQDSIG